MSNFEDWWKKLITDFPAVNTPSHKEVAMSAWINAWRGVPTTQPTCSVEFNSIGASKIAVIRAIREATSLGLKDSKDLSEMAPTIVKGFAGERFNVTQIKTLADKITEAGG